MRVDCIACSTPMAERYGAMYDDRYGCPGMYSLYACPSCGQLQTVPLLREGDLPALYAQYYPRRTTTIESVVAQAGDPALVATRFRRWLEGTDNQGHYAALPGTKVLDYGCGSGVSLLELTRLGAEAYGIEADPNVRRIADDLGLRIHIGTLDEEAFPGMTFDRIVLNQVIEHVPDPGRLLTVLKSRLNRGGRVSLSFPNAGSVYCRKYGRNWINWHIPYHLHHFNARSARRFFLRHGWKVHSLRTVTPNLWTALQLQAPLDRVAVGVPHPLWTGRGNRAAPGRARRAFIGLSNRVIDAFGVGDSILVDVTPDAQ